MMQTRYNIYKILILLDGKVMQSIPLVGNALKPEVPKMVMGVADRELGLESRFLG
jgi:hypothetical protein